MTLTLTPIFVTLTLTLITLMLTINPYLYTSRGMYALNGRGANVGGGGCADPATKHWIDPIWYAEHEDARYFCAVALLNTRPRPPLGYDSVAYFCKCTAKSTVTTAGSPAAVHYR